MSASDFFDKDTQALITAVRKRRRDQAEILFESHYLFFYAWIVLHYPHLNNKYTAAQYFRETTWRQPL